MPLSPNDVSDYVDPTPAQAAQLVVDIEEGRGHRHSVMASVDGGSVFTGQFTPSPDWKTEREAGGVDPTSKIYQSASPTSSLGTQLFAALFSGGLSRCWAQAVEHARSRAGLHVVIRSPDLAVHALPWELLSDPLTTTGPVALVDGWAVLRQQLRPTDAPDVGPVPPSDLKVLVLTSDATGVPRGNDPEVIRAALGGSHMDVVAHLRARDLLHTVGERNWHVVHILAFGVQTRQGRQSLVLGSADRPEAMPVQHLTEALRKHAEATRLVVLAAAKTDLLAAELAKVVPNVIGMRGTISDAGSQAFLRGLYGALASGSTIDQAVASGRAQQVGFSQSLGEEWALPVLFQTDGSPLVTAAEVPVAVEAEPPEAVGGTASEQAQRLLLKMKQDNLRAFQQRWDNVDSGSTPQFIREQLESLTDDVEKYGGSPS